MYTLRHTSINSRDLGEWKLAVVYHNTTVLILREKINEMLFPIHERPSSNPVDAQVMNEVKNAQ